MSDAIEWLIKLRGAFGETSAILLLFLLAAAFIYRRDLMKKTKDACDDRAVLLDVVVKNTESATRSAATSDLLAEAVNRLADSNRVAADTNLATAAAYTRQIDSIVSIVRDGRRTR